MADGDRTELRLATLLNRLRDLRKLIHAHQDGSIPNWSPETALQCVDAALEGHIREAEKPRCPHCLQTVSGVA